MHMMETLEIFRAPQNCRGGLRAIGVFVQVRGNRLHGGNAKVPQRKPVTNALGEGREVTAHASIYVQPQPVLFSKLSQLLNWIYEAVRPARSGAGYPDRVGVDCARHRGHVRVQILAEGRAHEFHAEVMAALGERRMRRVWHHDLR